MYTAAHVDFETRSTTDLRKSGIYRYVEDPNTGVWGFSYSFDDGVVYSWRPGDADPVVLLDHIRRGGVVKAHNAAFERLVWNRILRSYRYPDCMSWPDLKLAQMDCTMSRAAVLGLPLTLDGLCGALGTVNVKDKEGHALMQRMCRPRAFLPDGTIVWWDDEDRVRRQELYQEQDVRTEHECDEMLPPLTDLQRATWEFDQVINERGVHIDHVAVERAAALVEYAKKQNDKIMREITSRNVSKCSKDAELIAWLNSRGVDCTSLKKGEVDDVLYMATLAMDQIAHDAIKLRQAAWKTSTAKYRAMQLCVSIDNRIRGLLNYHGASTGRWAGRLVQPQNFPRLDHENEVLVQKINWLIELLHDQSLSIRDVYELMASVYGPLDVLDTLSKALRAMIVAEDGNKLVGGDFSNIEGRVNAWLANERWKLDAFREFDAGTGPDLYKLAYAKSFGVSVEEVGKGQKRQIGKVQELALGYQGSIGAFLTMGGTYGVNPFDISGPVMAATSPEQWDATALEYHRKGQNNFGLYEKEWTALKVIVNNFRSANKAIVQSWWDYQDAAIEAVQTPGLVVHVADNRVYYYSDGQCLWCVLPSGRMLCYMSPRIHSVMEEYTDRNGETRQRWKHSVRFMGRDSLTKQWKELSLYGGLQCENIVQAVAYDIMVDSMFKVEAVGFPIILTVHDELLAEVPLRSNWLTPELFEATMADIDQTIYSGLPIAVAAWQDKRYVK